ncbi:hypothetical protein [Streptomyces sp. NBC_01481]|uniref:hypothetical protein n=1 Tax=Streptomyces sp. NBC_01481 TaxID=2975869 RepID=UPI00224E7B7D|nr:hypothetical protein [Streptomyces sp. NBC_01481]MCX4584228.1 hypothetical protein [Streptomyces sp. NBC_01481]
MPSPRVTASACLGLFDDADVAAPPVVIHAFSLGGPLSVSALSLWEVRRLRIRCGVTLRSALGRWFRRGSGTLDEADGPGVAAQAVVWDPPDFSDLAAVVGVLAGEPVEALLVGEILHGQRCADNEVFVKDCLRRGIVRAGRAMMRSG